jgi:hypothetical protein
VNVSATIIDTITASANATSVGCTNVAVSPLENSTGATTSSAIKVA